MQGGMGVGGGEVGNDEGTRDDGLLDSDGEQSRESGNNGGEWYSDETDSVNLASTEVDFYALLNLSRGGGTRETFQETHYLGDNHQASSRRVRWRRPAGGPPWEDVQRSYKLLSRAFHPDRQVQHAVTHNPEQAFFVQIKQAHEILSDDVLRLVYDHTGMAGLMLVKLSQAKHSREAPAHVRKQPKEQADASPESSRWKNEQFRDDNDDNDDQSMTSETDSYSHSEFGSSFEHDADSTAPSDQEDYIYSDSHGSDDLYREIERAATYDQAVYVIRRAVLRYHFLRLRSEVHDVSFHAGLDSMWRLRSNSNLSSNPWWFLTDEDRDQSIILERDSMNVSFHCRKLSFPRNRPSPLQSPQQPSMGSMSDHGRVVHFSVGAHSRLNRQSESDVQIQGSLSCNPLPGTQVSVDTSIGHYRSQRYPVVNFRTQRQMSASGTVWNINFGGSTRDLRTWALGATTYRLVQWPLTSLNAESAENRGKGTDPGDSDNEDILSSQKRFLALWRIGFRPSDGNIVHLLTSIKSKSQEFPQWQFRLSTSTYPCKLSCHLNDSMYVSFATSGAKRRVKVTTSTNLSPRCRVLYGIKHEATMLYPMNAMGFSVVNGSNGADLGGLATPWTIHCKVQWGSDWTIRIPLGLVHYSQWPMLWFTSWLVACSLDHGFAAWNALIEEHFPRIGSSVFDATASPMPSAFRKAHEVPTLMSLCRESIERIAAKKRNQVLQNSESGGLAILQAKWWWSSTAVRSNDNSSGAEDDVTSLLQFWVREDASLYLALREARWRQLIARPLPSRPKSASWLSWVQYLFERKGHLREIETPQKGSLTVRYQLRQVIYEATYEVMVDDFLSPVDAKIEPFISLPSKQATALGLAGHVA
jgi:curved DNA-binding protein CbpA